MNLVANPNLCQPLSRLLSGRRKYLLLLGALVVTFFAIDVEVFLVAPHASVSVSDPVAEAHNQAIVIDLHADSMLWRRDLIDQAERGHVDFPRLRAGGVDGQGIGLASGLPISLNAVHNLWPLRCWISNWQQVEYQRTRLRDMVARSQGQAAIVVSAAELRANAKAGVTSLFFGLEGAHGLDACTVEVLDQARQEGMLYLGLVHLWDNGFGHHGGGDPEGGLTPEGRQLIEAMNQAGLLLDTAHMGSRTLQEAVALTAYPPISSHTGVKGVTEHWRNITDADIDAIASKDGVIGIMYGGVGFTETSLDEVVAHIDYVVQRVGEDHVALGSDWDGFIRTVVDARGLAQLTESLAQRGYSTPTRSKILGGNVLRVWDERDRVLERRKGAK